MYMHSSRNFKNKGKAVEHESDKNEEEEDGFSGIAAAPVTCMTIQKRQTYKRCTNFLYILLCFFNHGLSIDGKCERRRKNSWFLGIFFSGEEFSGEQWRKEKMNRAERLEKQLKTRWAVEEVIEEQLNRFHAQYNQAMIPTKLKDIAHLLTPKWAPPQELAALSWYGDWRPSTIPVLLHSLINSSSSFSTSLAADSEWVKTVMKQLINELRVEEAVIDEEMAEIQANCIFHLPFGITKKKKKNKKDGDALACVYTEFRKVHQVLTKAQNLRLKAMDMAVKKVLSPTDAAEFLVAFAKIQDLIHQHAMNMKLTNGPISVPTK
nr:Translation initiation factor IF-2 like [Ipomoea batatas]